MNKRSMADSPMDPGVYTILTGVFFLVVSIFIFASTGSIAAVFVVWLLAALVFTVLVYYKLLDVSKLIGLLFPEAPAKDQQQAPSPLAGLAGFPAVGQEVFHIAANQFTYDESRAVCAAYGAQLASLEQIIEAHNNGAEWCNYGWSAGGMALYPTQKATWDELQQEVDPARKTACGRPGVNGGYFDPNAKFGVNCFGFKPKGDFKPPAPVPGMDMTRFQSMVNRFRDTLKSLNVAPFSRTEWNGYGAQFTQPLGKLTETFVEHAENQFTEVISPSGAGAAPVGLRGDTGPAGPAGPRGPQGVPGASGLPGTMGAQGPPGAGLPGAVGPPGPAGQQGIQGGKGDKGDRGEKGEKGDRGLQGPAGSGGGGAVGPKGDRGDAGAKGDKGLKGDTGAQGPLGPAGPQGPQGPSGPQGIPGTVDPSLIATLNDLKTNTVRTDTLYGIKSTRGGFLSDQGTGQFKGMTAPASWEQMRFYNTGTRV